MEKEMSLQKKWAKRIDQARTVHKREMIQWADKVIQEFAGDFKTDKDTGERYDTIAQVVHAIESAIKPNLVFSGPKLFVKANKPEWESKEELVEAIVNHEYRAILPNDRRLELENELCLTDARLLPYGVTKTLYLVEGQLIDEEKDPETFGDKVKGFFTGEKPKAAQIPVITDEKGHVTERCDPLKVMIDPNCKHISKRKYDIEELDLSDDELAIPKYDQAKVAKLEPNVCLDAENKLDGKTLDNYFKEYPDLAGYRIYEIHDYEKRQIYTYSEQLKDFIDADIDDKNRKYPLEKGSQFSFLYFDEAPNRAYPLPPVKFYRRRAIEFSYIYSQLQKQVDKFQPRIGVDETKLSQESKEQLKTGGLASIFTTIGPPANAVQEFNLSIQKDVLVYLEALQKLMNLESGVSDYQTSNPDDKRTATEATYITQNDNARKQTPKKRVRDFVVGQASTILQTLMQHSTKENFIKILGEKEAMEWWTNPETGKNTWTKDDIVGDYSFELDMDSITPINEAVRRKQNVEAMTTVLNPALRQSLEAEGIKLILKNIFKKFVGDNLGMKDETKILEDLNIRNPEQEHDFFMQGIVHPIQQDENHEEHLQKHIAWRESSGAQFLPPELLNSVDKHIFMTQQLLAQKEQQKQSQQAPAPTAPSNEGQSPEARINQEAQAV